MIQCEERKEFCGGGEIFVVWQSLFVSFCVFLICCDVLAVKMLYHINI